MNQAQLLSQLEAYNTVCRNCGKREYNSPDCVTCPMEAWRQKANLDYIKSQHQQLKEYVVQTVQKRNMTYGAFDEMDARRQAEKNGHRVVRIMTAKDFQKHRDAYYMGYEDGAEFGRQAGFHEGYKAAMSLPDREEEEIANLGAQMNQGTLYVWKKQNP